MKRRPWSSAASARCSSSRLEALLIGCSTTNRRACRARTASRARRRGRGGSRARSPQSPDRFGRYLKEKVHAVEPAREVDAFLSPWYGWLVERLLAAIRPDDETGESAEAPCYETGAGRDQRRGGFRDAARAVPRHEEPRERRGFGDQQGRGGRSGERRNRPEPAPRRRHIALTPSCNYTPRGRRFSGSNGDSAITFAGRRSISTETVRSVPGLAISTGRQVCTSSRPRVCE